MFDPSKLDLNLENLDEKPTEVTPSAKKEEDPLTIVQTEISKEPVAKEVITEPTPIVKEPVLEPEVPRIIYDINITSLENILVLIAEKAYDYVTLVPSLDSVEIKFFKNQREETKKFITYPVYSHILIQSKTKTHLNVEISNKEQEGKGDVVVKTTNYTLLTKIVPNETGEKIFLKLAPGDKKIIAKAKKQVSLQQILLILGAGLIGILVVGGAFLTFVLLNSNNVADLTFFNNLGVDVGSIKDFTSSLVDAIFFSIIFIETILVFVFTFKAILTKIEFKKKKIARSLLSAFLLILVMISGFLWLTLSKQINSLKGLNYGKIEYYDNSKYLSDMFDESGTTININDRLIGPITIRFNIEEFLKKLIDDGFTPKNITWVFPDEEITKPIEDYEIIKEFKQKGLHNVLLRLEGINLKGEDTVLEQNIADVNVANLVQVTEQKKSNGGSVFDFDASDLSNLGKIEWFYIPSTKGKTDSEKTNIISKALSEALVKGNQFTSNLIFDEEVILGMKIVIRGEEKDTLDKIFIISKNEKDTINGEIKFQQSQTNDLEYELMMSNVATEFGEGVIEKFTWTLGDKEFSTIADLTDLDNSSKITHVFSQYGENTVSVSLTDNRGQVKTFSTIIDVPKNLKLKVPLSISNENGDIDGLIYEAPLNTYYINRIGTPTTLKLDARSIRASNILYTLQNVEWDFDSNGDIDSKDKYTEYNVAVEGNHTITVKYTFVHRKITTDIITITEQILIEGIKKEAILDLVIKKESNYAPITVGFDASKSQVKNENIVKFIWDYGDGQTEERDAVVPGHKYTVAGDYVVTLKVITENGKEFQISKKLILNPKPQSVKVTSSLKKAPVHQGIDFLSEQSEGQIIGYFWDFGDGETSIEANPTHEYSKPGNYLVKLKIDFANNNVLEDTVAIEIFE